MAIYVRAGICFPNIYTFMPRVVVFTFDCDVLELLVFIDRKCAHEYELVGVV